MEHRMSTPEVEDLNIRRIVLNGILESEKKYIKCMEELLKVLSHIATCWKVSLNDIMKYWKALGIDLRSAKKLLVKWVSLNLQCVE